MKSNSPKKNTSIAGQSAAHFVATDESLAALLLNQEIKIRDFIVLSFLSDQGPMTILRLSRVVGIEPEKMFNSLERLSAVNLAVREPAPTAKKKYESVAKLTSQGQDIASKINSELN